MVRMALARLMRELERSGLSRRQRVFLLHVITSSKSSNRPKLPIAIKKRDGEVVEGKSDDMDDREECFTVVFDSVFEIPSFFPTGKNELTALARLMRKVKRYG